MLNKSKKTPKSRLNKSEGDSTTKFQTAGLGSKKGNKEWTGTGAGEKKKISQDVIKGLANATSRVVQQAASILEEEVAAGIVAAKDVESRLVNVKDLRSGKPDEVIHRFRRDAHEVMDIFIDLAHAATQYVGGLAQRVVTIRGSERKEKPQYTASGQLPTLKTDKAMKPGGVAKIPMDLENNSDKIMDKFSFHSTDLVDASGNRITAERISFTPSTLSLAPYKTQKVVVAVNIPAKISAGIYSGLIRATKMDQLQAILVIQVD